MLPIVGIHSIIWIYCFLFFLPSPPLTVATHTCKFYYYPMSVFCHEILRKKTTVSRRCTSWVYKLNKHCEITEEVWFSSITEIHLWRDPLLSSFTVFEVGRGKSYPFFKIFIYYSSHFACWPDSTNLSGWGIHVKKKKSQLNKMKAEIHNSLC